MRIQKNTFADFTGNVDAVVSTIEDDALRKFLKNSDVRSAITDSSILMLAHRIRRYEQRIDYLESLKILQDVSS